MKRILPFMQSPKFPDVFTVLMMNIDKCVNEPHHHEPILEASKDHLGDQVIVEAQRVACSQKEIYHTLHDVVETNVVDSAGSFISEIWLEQHFRATRNVRRDSDNVFVWENILDLHRGWSQCRQLLLKRPLEHGRAT